MNLTDEQWEMLHSLMIIRDGYRDVQSSLDKKRKTLFSGVPTTASKSAGEALSKEILYRSGVIKGTEIAFDLLASKYGTNQEEVENQHETIKQIKKGEL